MKKDIVAAVLLQGGDKVILSVTIKLVNSNAKLNC
jgi:hypothetical protein